MGGNVPPFYHTSSKSALKLLGFFTFTITDISFVATQKSWNRQDM